MYRRSPQARQRRGASKNGMCCVWVCLSVMLVGTGILLFVFRDKLFGLPKPLDYFPETIIVSGDYPYKDSNRISGRYIRRSVRKDGHKTLAKGFTSNWDTKVNSYAEISRDTQFLRVKQTGKVREIPANVAPCEWWYERQDKENSDTVHVMVLSDDSWNWNADAANKVPRPGGWKIITSTDSRGSTLQEVACAPITGNGKNPPLSGKWIAKNKDGWNILTEIFNLSITAADPAGKPNPSDGKPPAEKTPDNGKSGK